MSVSENWLFYCINCDLFWWLLWFGYLLNLMYEASFTVFISCPNCSGSTSRLTSYQLKVVLSPLGSQILTAAVVVE